MKPLDQWGLEGTPGGHSLLKAGPSPTAGHPERLPRWFHSSQLLRCPGSDNYGPDAVPHTGPFSASCSQELGCPSRGATGLFSLVPAPALRPSSAPSAHLKAELEGRLLFWYVQMCCRSSVILGTSFPRGKCRGSSKSNVWRAGCSSTEQLESPAWESFYKPVLEPAAATFSCTSLKLVAFLCTSKRAWCRQRL